MSDQEILDFLDQEDAYDYQQQALEEQEQYVDWQDRAADDAGVSRFGEI